MALAAGSYRRQMSELPEFIRALVPTPHDQLARTIGWFMLSAVVVELLGTATGLWPSMIATAALSIAHRQGLTTPLTYWIPLRLSWSEVIAFAISGIVLLAGHQLSESSDKALWRVSLVRREPQPIYRAALAMSFAIMLSFNLWSLVTLPLPGSMPIPLRLLAVAASFAILSHVAQRVQELAKKNLGFHNSFLASMIASIVLPVLSIGLATLLGVHSGFPTVNGELRVTQWLAGVALTVAFGIYVYNTLCTQVSQPSASSPKSPGQVTVYDVSVEIQPNEVRPDNVIFLRTAPPLVKDRIPALGIVPENCGIVAYREECPVNAFTRVTSGQLRLMDEPFLLIDVHAIPRRIRSQQNLDPSNRRNKYVKGVVSWALMLQKLPRRMDKEAWENLERVFVRPNDVISCIDLQVRRRIDELLGAICVQDPQAKLSQLQRALGLELAESFVAPETRAINTDSTGNAQMDELLRSCTGLAHFAFRRHALKCWAENAENQAQSILNLISALPGRFEIDSLASVLPHFGISLETSPSTINLARTFTFCAIEGEQELRLTPDAEPLLVTSGQTVHAWLQSTDNELQKRSQIFCDQLNFARDKERAEWNCAHTVQQIANQGFWSPDILPLVIQHMTNHDPSAAERLLRLIDRQSPPQFGT